MKRRLQAFVDRNFEMLVVGILFAVLLGVGLWIAFAAPCDAIGFLPSREMPGRCFR